MAGKPQQVEQLEPRAPAAGASATKANHFLYPGRIFTSKESKTITIIVGSCIAVCLWDSRPGIGGAAHYMLPVWEGDGEPSARYGDIAIKQLIQELTALGVGPKQLRAKLFGGNCMFQAMRDNANLSVGAKNIRIAYDLLAQTGILVTLAKVGGARGQRIIFQTNTGESSDSSL